MARFGDREHMKFPSYLLSLLLCYQTNPVGLHVKPRFYVPCHKTFPYSTVTISPSLLQCRAQSIRYKVNGVAPGSVKYFHSTGSGKCGNRAKMKTKRPQRLPSPPVSLLPTGFEWNDLTLTGDALLPEIQHW